MYSDSENNLLKQSDSTSKSIQSTSNFSTMNLNDNNDEISFREIILKLIDWWRYLLSKWLIIGLISLIGSFLGLFYAIRQVPTFKAELNFAVEDEQGGGGGGYAGIASQFGFDIGGGGGGAFEGDNLLQLMRSRLIIEKSLLSTVQVNSQKKTLADFYIDFNGIDRISKESSQLIQFIPNEDRSNYSRSKDSLLGVLHKNIISDNLAVNKVDKKLSIITVSVTSGNEIFSKAFAEVLVKEVSDFYVETKTKKSSSNLAVLQHQTDSVRRELNSAISGVAQSIDNNPNPNIGMQRLKVPSQKRNVDVQANQAMLSEMVKNLEMSKIALRKETPLIQIIDRPIFPLEKRKYGKLQGLVTGGLIAGFSIVLFLVLMRIYYQFKSSISPTQTKY